jgi:coenzyme F420-reducing hydrogenase gamma subunit
MDIVKKTVYGANASLFDTYLARPIDAVIPVDAYVHGCPMTKEEFLNVVKSLLLGKKPEIPNYPVCVECKKNENVCAFERGEFCVGPVTRAGCNSCCVNEGTKCWGCRGMVDNPNENSQKEVLIKYGLSVDDAIGKFKLYFGWEKKK